MSLIDGEQSLAELQTRLDAPEVASMTLHKTLENGAVKVFRREVKGGLFEYKAIGTFREIAGARCFEVLQDTAYRKTWDANLREATPLPNMDNGWQIVVRMPTLMTDRDYVVVRTADETVDDKGRRVWTMLTASCVNPAYPPRKGWVRVEDSFQGVAFRENGSGVDFYVHCFDDLKGALSASQVNSIVDSGIPTFLSSFKKACAKYSVYQAQASKGASVASAQVRSALSDGLDKAFSGITL